MSSNIVLSTPRPSLAPNAYTHTGRGGAGNTYRASKTTVQASTAPPAASSSSKPRRFYSGVGGAGNVHAAGERPPAGTAIDEEIARARARERSGFVRSGIGGAGNVFRKGKRETDDGAVEKERRGSQWSLSSLESVLKPTKS